MRKLVWFSCGAASATLAKLATEKYPDCEILYCNTLSYEHPDNLRFLHDVERWTGKKIKILQSDKYTDIFDVFRRTGWLVGVGGARCTFELKRNVRKRYEQPGDLHLFGLTADEQKRIDQFEKNNPTLDLEWMLADVGITKQDCYTALLNAKIELPAMYRMGYNNNNCIGCVKGQQGYWNKIRKDFPDAFDRMAKLERELNVAINKSYAGDGKRKRVFLDELDPEAGRGVPEPDIECGVLCVSERNQPLSIYDATLNQTNLED